MSLRLPTRALFVVLTVVAGIGATLFVMRPPSSGSEEPKIILPKLAGKAPATPAHAKKPVKTKAKTPARQAVAPAAKPKVKPTAAPVPVAAPKPKKPAAPPVDDNGLPRVLSTALASNSVVVVGLYDPNSAVDKITLDEARAGARAAGAGFVAINVFAEAQSRPLVELLGALENPGILVYRKPDALFARISGFADSETVAQAAANAAR
jgi:hypothetical protein